MLGADCASVLMWMLKFVKISLKSRSCVRPDGYTHPASTVKSEHRSS